LAIGHVMDQMVVESILNPGKSMKAPAAKRSAPLLLVYVAFEPFADIESVLVTCPSSGLCGQGGALATTTQEQQVIILAHLAAQLADKPRISVETHTVSPGNMQGIGNMAHEMQLLCAAHIDNFRDAGLKERPGQLRAQGACIFE